MVASLHQCGGCNASFSISDFAHLTAATSKTAPNTLFQRIKKVFTTLNPFPPKATEVNPESLIFTCCEHENKIAIHVFNKTCLSTWIRQSKENCPTCRTPIYKHQLGKTVTQLLDIFLKALRSEEDLVKTTLNATDRSNDRCVICTDDLPIIPLRYDPVKTQLYHDHCDSEHPQLFIPDLIKIAQDIINKTPDLKSKYTPKPLSLLETLLHDYPLAARVVFFGGISISAFTLNRNQFGGNNWPLFILGLPVYFTLVSVHNIGLLIFTLQNLRRTGQI